MKITKEIDGVLLTCGYAADDSSKLVIDSLQLVNSNNLLTSSSVDRVSPAAICARVEHCNTFHIVTQFNSTGNYL